MTRWIFYNVGMSTRKALPLLTSSRIRNAQIKRGEREAFLVEGNKYDFSDKRK
jgi:hypothetical protein